jgi:pimeloyl-ACP methyl ester carboxylesterase
MGRQLRRTLAERRSPLDRGYFADIPLMNDAAETIYFHGLPGTPDELKLARRPVPGNWQAIDRSVGLSGGSAEAYFDHLAERVRDMSGGAPIRLVGFSLGAVAALQVASRITDRSVSLHLVSAAAPLQSGDFLPRMAGKSVFSLARRSPLAFSGLCAIQSAIVRVSVKPLAAALFSSAQGLDLELKNAPQFKAQIAGIFRHGLGLGLQNYKREIAAYVQDWSVILLNIRHEVTLWHGEMDNWSPPEMAATLGRMLPNVSAVNILPEHSHYSTLVAYFQQNMR